MRATYNILREEQRTLLNQLKRPSNEVEFNSVTKKSKTTKNGTERGVTVKYISLDLTPNTIQNVYILSITRNDAVTSDPDSEIHFHEEYVLNGSDGYHSMWQLVTFLLAKYYDRLSDEPGRSIEMKNLGDVSRLDLTLPSVGYDNKTIHTFSIAANHSLSNEAISSFQNIACPRGIKSYYLSDNRKNIWCNFELDLATTPAVIHYLAPQVGEKEGLLEHIEFIALKYDQLPANAISFAVTDLKSAKSRLERTKYLYTLFLSSNSELGPPLPATLPAWLRTGKLNWDQQQIACNCHSVRLYYSPDYLEYIALPNSIAINTDDCNYELVIYQKDIGEKKARLASEETASIKLSYI